MVSPRDGAHEKPESWELKSVKRKSKTDVKVAAEVEVDFGVIAESLWDANVYKRVSIEVWRQLYCGTQTENMKKLW